MSRSLDRFLQRLQRTMLLGPAQRPRSTHAAIAHPGERIPPTRAATAVRVVVAVAVPLAFGAALIPVRDDLTQSISLLMVVPVLLLAVTAGARIAALAAFSAALAFDVFHTMPYYRLTIADLDDVVEMVVLVAIGVLTGLITESAQRAIASTRVRQRELSAATDFIERAYLSEPDDLVVEAQRSIERLLLARQCRWQPGYHGTAGPVLSTTGAIVAGTSPGASRPATTKLPSDLEIPVGTPPDEHGRFVLRTSDADISIEERRAAATIAAALGRAISSRDA